MGLFFASILAAAGFSAWAHTLVRRRELESTAVQREQVHTLAESVRFLRSHTDTLESENKDLRKQLGMSPMRRPGHQAESGSTGGLRVEATLAAFQMWMAEWMDSLQDERKAKKDNA